MENNMREKNKNINSFSDWKMKNKEYLVELQRFLDKVDNVENEELKNDIIQQMLKCDRVITKIAQEKIDEYSIKKCNK